MKTNTNIHLVLILLLLIPCCLPLEGKTSDDQKGGKINWMDGNWRAWDVNADGKFDKHDIEKLLDNGWQTFATDLNYDSRNDVSDVFALYVRLSVLDRNCDLAVDDNDYIILAPVEIPEPDLEKVWLIVNEIVPKARIKAGLKPDVEEKLLGSADESLTRYMPGRAYVFEVAGLSALFQKNIDAAMWAFGRSFQIFDRSPSGLNNLAFALAMNNQHDYALELLAYARTLPPELATTETITGWIYARHGQDEEALKHYLKAVELAPEISQYHMNLGITYLRLGKTEEAHKEFLHASEKDRKDFKARLFGYTVPPKDPPPPEEPPVDPEKIKEEYEEMMREREEQEDHGDEGEEDGSHHKLSPCDFASMIREVLEERYTVEQEKYSRNAGNSAVSSINGVISGFMPKWNNCLEDYELYKSGVRVIPPAAESARVNANDAAAGNWMTLRMAWGNELMGYSTFFYEQALKHAAGESDRRFSEFRNLPFPAEHIARIKSEMYRDVLEESLRHCYEEPVREAIALYKAPYQYVAAEPDPGVDALPFGPGVYMAIVSRAISVEGYCPDGNSDGFSPAEAALPDLTIGFDWGIIEFEWNLETGELELNLGEGFFVGATWSPQAGFGVQAGIGFDAQLGPLRGVAKTYIHWRNGEIGWTGELGVSVGPRGKMGGKEGGFNLGGELTTVCMTTEEGR
jgi:tetratricopeptide (TPR) repeat protein